MHQLTLGFSPCPNDTFIFDQLVHKSPINTDDIQYQHFMEDVETLNQWAFEGRLDITKLSYSAFLQLTEHYELLDSGSALGFGVGPLLICKQENLDKLQHPEAINAAKIAIPGKYTTANLLLSLAYPNARNKTEMLFSEIESAVLSGQFDAGLIIHENRFTYADRGLAKIMDCGAWWEEKTGAAIPLGGIVIKKNLPHAVKRKVEEDIRNSVQASWNKYPELSLFIREHAQEMSEEVMRKHINLYVNEHTTSLGTEGNKAIRALFERAYAAGLIPSIPENYKLAAAATSDSGL